MLKHCLNEFLEVRKVPVVSPKSTRQLPNPFHGVKLRAVGRKKIKSEYVVMISQPRLKHLRMVPPGIIENNDHLPTPSLVAHKLLQKGERGLGTELLGSHGDESSVCDAHRPKDRDAFPGWGMEYNRVHILRWDPHGAPGAMLLEMAFVLAPQIKIISSGEAA